MKGFDANVPKRKPRTRLASMLAELDSAPETEAVPISEPPQIEAESAAEPSHLGGSGRPVLPPHSPHPGDRQADLDTALLDTFEDGLVVINPPPAKVESRRSRVETRIRPSPEVDAGGAVVKTGKARIAELRARLEAANKRREEKPPEPEATASRVRETVAALSRQLEETRTERSELVQALETARTELAEMQELLESERKGRSIAESLATERQSVADELLVESEALAQERDRALGCIAELKELDAQQSALLLQVESTLADRDRVLDRAKVQLAELRASCEAATADADAMQARLQLVLAERSDLETRIGKLEAELARAHSARQALGEIQKLVDGIS